MAKVKLSIYSSLFNVTSNKFGYKDFLAHVCSFGDEVVVATIKDGDGSYELLCAEKEQYKNLVVILSDLQPNIPTFDGALKDAALQACTGNLMLQLDGDERLGISDRVAWEYYFQFLLNSGKVQCIMLPSINLYKDNSHFSDITFKWYLHKRGLKRGVVDFARRPDGTHNIHGNGASDSCELLDENNRLVNSIQLVEDMGAPLLSWWKIQDSLTPYIVHYGYIDLDRRAELNKNFWAKMWSIEDGRPVNLPTEGSKIIKPSFPLGKQI